MLNQLAKKIKLSLKEKQNIDQEDQNIFFTLSREQTIKFLKILIEIENHEKTKIELYKLYTNIRHIKSSKTLLAAIWASFNRFL